MFKVGDYVVLVKGDHKTLDPFVGKTMEVKQITRDLYGWGYVYCDEIGGGWCADRFELAKETHVEDLEWV